MVLEVPMLSGKVRDALVVLIAFAWLVSIFGAIFNPDYKPDPSINGAFGLVVGAVLAAGKKENGKDDDDTPRRGRR